MKSILSITALLLAVNTTLVSATPMKAISSVHKHNSENVKGHYSDYSRVQIEQLNKDTKEWILNGVSIDIKSEAGRVLMKIND